ncbi:MAG: chorismate synthase [Chlamydiota bacterium]
MPGNTFGKNFIFTTWGESHGKAIGVVIDGCPPGITLDEDVINKDLDRRAPGKGAYSSPRKESDRAEILSGVFEGKTTGTPISIIIPNEDPNPKAYSSLAKINRPGHADYTYRAKYGIYDYRGGGRASGRETACRVAAGAVAQKILEQYQIKVEASLKTIGGSEDPEEWERLLKEAYEQGDSLGGIVEGAATNLPAGLGEPVYDKMEARLAAAMLSIPGTKGFEIGSGFSAAEMTGSHHNDAFLAEGVTSSNNAGGILGGITNGMPLVVRVAFKPTSSIKAEQRTTDIKGAPVSFVLSKEARHDTCIAIRAVPVVEAMLKVVIADFLLLNRCLV